MNRQFAIRMIMVLVLLSGIATFGPAARAQHGGHGGHGGHFGGHAAHFGGHIGSHGGHGGAHFGGHIGHHDVSHYGGDFGLAHHGFHYFPVHVDFHSYPWYALYDYPTYDSSYYQYYAAAGPVYIQRVYVGEQDSQTTPPPPRVAETTSTAAGLDYQRRAVEAFRAGDFTQAARLANHALVEMPRDGKLLLFTAQTLFAVGDYRSAAAAIHQAAALLDADQWGYIVENYRQYYRGRTYFDQMDRLNAFMKENPDTAYAYFLRGYQHGYLGHRESARRDLNKVLELESRDQLASRLIEHFGGNAPSGNSRNPAAVPGAQANGHEGHDHGTDGQNGGRDGENHGELASPPNPLSAPSLIDDSNAPLAVDLVIGKSTPANDETPAAAVLAALSKLSPSDRATALAQRTCPITGDVLGSDGTPIKVRAGGRDVFVCCQGCVEDLKSDPAPYLAKLKK